jgi:heptosyltransferase-2
MSRRFADDFAAKERVLVFEVNWLGDVLFSTPALRAIRKKHPGAFITVLVPPRCKPVLTGNNYIDEVLVYDDKGVHRGLFGFLRLVRDLRVRRFSRVYFFKPSTTRQWCAYLAGIKERVGFARKAGFLLTQKVTLPAGTWHRADVFYYLVARERISEFERHCDFFVSVEDRVFIEEFLRKNNLGGGRRMAALHVGGNWDLKRWPPEHFARLIDILSERYGADVIMTGAFSDGPLAQKIASLATQKSFDACGQTTLKQLGALFQKSDVVISADSGPLHVAMAVQARTIALFGPTLPEVTGPMGSGDRSVLHNKEGISCALPCYHLDCADNVCMKSITPEQVVEAIEKNGWLK